MILLPIPPGQKGPKIHGWNEPEFTPEAVPVGWNTGLRLDGLTVVDCDSQAACDWWEEYGEPTAFVTESRPGHRAFWYKGESIPPGFIHWYLPNGERGGEVRAGHKVQCVVPPSVHPSGTTYEWLGHALRTGTMHLVPSLPVERLPVRGGAKRVAEDGWTSVSEYPEAEYWTSERCPAHPDTSPSLMVGHHADGTVVLHCMAGCPMGEVIEAAEATGMYQRDDLWPPKPETYWEEVQRTCPDLARRLTDAALAKMELPPIQWVVPGVLPEGLAILGGKPKVGKSWMALDLGLSVAMGRPFLGEAVDPGDVLYLALEDNLRRVQWRSARVRGDDPPTERLEYQVLAPRLGDGLEELIDEWLTGVRAPRLIIVDTLGMVRPASGSDDPYNYDEAYRALGTFKKHTDKLGVAIVVVHHVRKAGAEDPLDTLAGSVGIAGAADTILVVRKTDTGGTLMGRGRDLAEVSLELAFDEDTFRWRQVASEEAEQARAEAGAKKLELKVRNAVAAGTKWGELSRSLTPKQRDAAMLMYQQEGGQIGRGK